MSEAHTLGALIRQHRLAASLSQAVLAERAQLSAATIAALERGRSSRPRPATVLLLAEALGLSPQAQAALIDAANGGGRPEGGQITSAPVMPAPIGLHHNLPHALTDFVGRDRDLAEVVRALSEMRLVTLTGPGGAGKTRLAVEAASRLARRPSRYTGGIWRVELAPLTDGVQVPRAVASSLGIQELPGQPVLESVIGWLRGRQALLVLDNCEHLLAPCAATISAVLETCPDVTILATSREALNVTGEVVWRVGPLHESAGLQMFVSLAARASPEFQLTSEVRSAVIRVCKRLDGLPLAIELAAARVNALSVEEIENRLDQRFVLFNTGRRTSLPRHRTLRALVDWSYDLLPADEQRLFQQLSVFSGGWTLDAAEAVCEAGLDVLPLLLSLVDKSLVQVDQHRGRSRFRLLETLRAYAANRLLEAGAESGVRNRHLRWCERLARDGDPGLSGPEHQEWLQRLEAEIDNFRAALRWSLDEPAGRDAGLRLAASLVRFWFLDGGTAEGSEWLAALLARAPRGAARVDALSASGFLLVRRGNPRAARPLLEEAVEEARRLGDNSLLAVPLNHLGELLVQEGDLAGARRALEESLELNVDGADRTVFWPPYVALYNLGEVAAHEGNPDAAAAFHERSIELASERHDGFRMAPLRLLGQLAIDLGDLVRANALLAESLIVARDWGKAGYGVAPVLVYLAELAVAEGQPERALRLAGAAAGLREARQARLQPTDAARVEARVRSARSMLGDVAAAEAWSKGQSMTLDEAVDYALQASRRPSSATLT